MVRKRNYRAEKRPPTVPFSNAEDDKVAEITRIGLSSHLWGEALPGRTFGEILDRRYELQEQGLCPRSRTE